MTTASLRTVPTRMLPAVILRGLLASAALIGATTAKAQEEVPIVISPLRVDAEGVVPRSLRPQAVSVRVRGPEPLIDQLNPASVLAIATVIAAPDGRVNVSPFANPGLASAGTGDVLAGVIAGLVAQGMPFFEAATCGVYLHGKAGEMVRDMLGDAGMMASDMLPFVPRAIKAIGQG